MKVEINKVDLIDFTAHKHAMLKIAGQFVGEKCTLSPCEVAELVISQRAAMRNLLLELIVDANEFDRRKIESVLELTASK